MITPEQMTALIDAKHITLLSFDIFDTLITRPFEKPVQVFSYMTEISPLVPKSFPQCRPRAEQLARRDAEGGEVNMGEIYAVLAEMEGYTPELCKTLCSLEKETELRLCKPREEGAALFRKAASMDIRVILISDMYLSRERISRMLCKCDLKNFAELYISCEYRKNKANGDLFRYVRKIEELPYSTMLHIGDNPVSDVIVPKNLGMHAIYLPLQENAPMPELDGVDRLLPHGTLRRKYASALARRIRGGRA